MESDSDNCISTLTDLLPYDVVIERAFIREYHAIIIGITLFWFLCRIWLTLSTFLTWNWLYLLLIVVNFYFLNVLRSWVGNGMMWNGWRPFSWPIFMWICSLGSLSWSMRLLLLWTGCFCNLVLINHLQCYVNLLNLRVASPIKSMLKVVSSWSGSQKIHLLLLKDCCMNF